MHSSGVPHTWRHAALPSALALLALCVFGPAVSGSPFSDEFSGTTLDAAWNKVNLNASSSIQLTGSGQLQMVASGANGGSDLYITTNYNAPRILQSIGDLTDWSIETKVTFAPTTDYQGAGIILVYGPNPSDCWRAAERTYYAYAGGQIIRAIGGYEPFTETTSYFLVIKTGDIYTGYYSADGEMWTNGGTFTYATPPTQVGLYTIRQPWEGSTDSVANFDYFRITPEPATLSLLALGGLATFLGRARRSRR